MDKGFCGITKRHRVIAGRPVREYEYAEPIGAVDITEDADGLGAFRGILFAALLAIVIALVFYFGAVLILSLEHVK